tara:strand:- start:9972 stop:10424 length:453 start_codon:yes stop_codon:yes gene_type:complete
MVEALGTGRGITPSIGKGVKRRNIRYNANGSVNDPTTIHKRNGGRKLGFRGTLTEYEQDARRAVEAEIETLKYYFDEEWFSPEEDTIAKMSESSRIRWEGTPNKPFRCKGCKNAFHRHYNTRLSGMYEKLPGSIFNRVRLQEGECDTCKT